jgi:hypothetical protein
MASANVKRPCAKCSKGAGVTTCDGCQQSFCVKHFVEHRQELSHRMEDIGQEHDLLRRDLDRDNAEHSLLSRINTWEQESITKIQVAAEVARADLQELLVRNKEELRKSVTKITNELQAGRESDDYTEMDINKWTKQLQELRKMLESPSTIDIDESEASKSAIRFIKVRDQQQHRLPNSAVGESNRCSNERFNEVDGKALISEEGLVATFDGNSVFSRPIIYGANRYSSGTHRIHFRIDRIGKLTIFLGITTSFVKITETYSYDQALYGWWDLFKIVVNGNIQQCDGDKVVRTGDEMTLILDCDNRQIQLQHHRTNLSREVSIDINKCPFPWKAVVQFKYQGDSVRILQ